MNPTKLSHTEKIVEQNRTYSYFPWSVQGSLDPIAIDRAEGVYLYASDGKKYIDFSSQLINSNIGHGRQEVTAAVVEQMQKTAFVGPSFATEVRGKLAKKLAEITPGNLSKTFFTLGGAESTENALILARLYTGRHKIISNYRSYHGATQGAFSAGGDPRKLMVDSNPVPNIIHVENPYSYRCPWYSSSPEECGERAIQNLRNIVKYEGPENVAAIMMEGESGTSGCIKYPPFYLKHVKALCEEYGILFIADEVMSGFGRTGKWFGVDHHEITPDILCFAKGVTSGYVPLGGIITTDTIAERFEENYLPLGLTYSGHAVSCAAALAVLDIYEKENLIERAANMGRYMDEQVEELKMKHRCIGDWRNTGMLGCLELVKNRETKEHLGPWNAPLTEPMQKAKDKLKELGLYTFVKWNLIFIAPPLVITEDEVDEGLAIISEALALADAYCE